MITEHDLQEAIAECQGQRNPNASTAIKLAAFLTIQRELFGNAEENNANASKIFTNATSPAYSYAAEPPETIPRYSGAESVGDYGDSDFLRAVRGKDPAAMWAVMDELMDTLKMVNQRVYDGVMRRIR